MKYVKSPIFYMGNKFRLLKQIIPLFPENINNFYDVFGGSGVVCMNINAKAVNIFYNDNNKLVFNLLKLFKNYNANYIIQHIQKRILEFNLSKNNKESYLKFREFINNYDYENNLDLWYLDLYTISFFSFSNIIRLRDNKLDKAVNQFGKRAFNVPTGKSSFKKTQHQQKIENGCNFFKNAIFNVPFGERTFKENDAFKIKNGVKLFKKIEADNLDFKEFINNIDIKEGDFFYFDPPYLIGDAVYQRNKKNENSWSEKDEMELYKICEVLNKKGAKWAISNNILKNEIEHILLKKWIEKNNWNVHKMVLTYAACGKGSKKTQEVLITNY